MAPSTAASASPTTLHGLWSGAPFSFSGAHYQAGAGVTWWVENFNNERGSLEAQRARLRKGPPRQD